MELELDLGGIFEQNSTYNYEDFKEYEDECKPESGGRFAVWFVPPLYCLVLVVGLLGNGLLLVVLCQRRRLWSGMDIFFLNLFVANILLLVPLPFWVVQTAQGQHWDFGARFCMATGAVFTVSYYCGMLLLTFVSVDRYLSILHNTHLFSRRKLWLVQTICAVIWVLSLLLSVPDWIFLTLKGDERRSKTLCLRDYERLALDWRLPSRLFYHVAGFLLPLAALLYGSSCILARLSCGPRRLQKQRAAKVILSLAALFFLCWMPYNVALVVDTLRGQSTAAPEGHAGGSCDESRVPAETVLTVTSAVGCLHACLNPLLCLGLCRVAGKRSPKTRAGVKAAQAGAKLALWELSVVEDDSPDRAPERVKMTSIVQQVESTVS